jgi:60 kDa SS-A/Ro ribonucleoprotein
MDPLKNISTRVTPQNEAAPGTVPNSAGGHSFEVDRWGRLRRFLILGTEGGTYYIGEKALTKDAAKNVLDCLDADPQRTVDEIVAVSTEGRAPKQNPAIFALAAAAGHPVAGPIALSRLNEVCRTSTHLFDFTTYVQQFRGWGPALRRSVSDWYLSKDANTLGHQVVKYRQRNGWTHRDILRQAHPKATGPVNDVLRWTVRGEAENLPDIIKAYEAAQSADEKAMVELIREFRLPWEALPSEALRSPAVWSALIPHMGLTALIRNLGRLTANGTLKPLSDLTNEVARRIQDPEALRKARVHPLAILLAEGTYRQGRGQKGSLTWTPIDQILDALNAAFTNAFAAVEPAGKRTMYAIDVSASMTWTGIAGTPVTPREAAGALALVGVNTEPRVMTCAFDTTFSEVSIPKGATVSSVAKMMDRMHARGTDCALPMIEATNRGLEIDTFVVLTDNETWAGTIHPFQALRQYREKSGIPAKLIVVGMEGNPFTIADPKDPGMLDVVGFDAGAPAFMADFSAGRV